MYNSAVLTDAGRAGHARSASVLVLHENINKNAAYKKQTNQRGVRIMILTQMLRLLVVNVFS